MLVTCISVYFDYSALYFQSCSFISEELLQMEIEESLERLSVVERVCIAYQECFFQHKDKNPPVPDWNFNSFLIFARLQKFLDRIDTLQVMRKDVT